MSEIWRDVPSVPGILVSSEGRVMHTPYRQLMPKGGNRSYGGEPTYGVWNKLDGRFTINIRGHTYKVHRLIAEAFHGPPTIEKPVAMHLDENAANNRADNIQWGTQKDNLSVGRLYCLLRKSHWREQSGRKSPQVQRGRNSPVVKARKSSEVD